MKEGTPCLPPQLKSSEEFELESATTRRLLERVPADQLNWKPHPKSIFWLANSHSTWRLVPD